MRLTSIVLLCALAAGALAAASVRAGEPARQPQVTARAAYQPALKVVRLAADSLVATADPAGGLRWPVADDDASSASGFELGAAGIAAFAARLGRVVRQRPRRPTRSLTSAHTAPPRQSL